MADARDLPEAIQWHEGMLLGPQHFQQLSLRHEELVHYHTITVSPFHWGIRRMSVDHLLLPDGLLRILSLEAIMPDGLIVGFDHQEDHRLELDLTPYADEMHRSPLAIHLIVPVKTGGRVPVHGEQRRFDSVEGRPVVDANTGTSSISIPSLRPRLSLMAAKTPPGKYASFPLVEVHYQDDSFGLSDFIAPTVNVDTGSPLEELCSQVGQKVRGKAFSLSEKAQSPALLARPLQSLETRFMLQAMVSSLPSFEGILHTNQAHPLMLYLALCQMAGNMASLGAGLVTPVFSSYNHNDLRTTFEEVINYINRMMEEGVPETHTPLPFNYEEGVFSIKLERVWAVSPLLIGVRIRPGTSEHVTMEWMDACLIGSESNVDHMRVTRILGPDRIHVEEEEGLVPPRGILLFSVKADPRFIVPGQDLVVVNLSDPKGHRAPLELLLYVRNEAGRNEPQDNQKV